MSKNILQIYCQAVKSLVESRTQKVDEVKIFLRNAHKKAVLSAYTVRGKFKRSETRENPKLQKLFWIKNLFGGVESQMIVTNGIQVEVCAARDGSLCFYQLRLWESVQSSKNSRSRKFLVVQTSKKSPIVKWGDIPNIRAERGIDPSGWYNKMKHCKI